MNVCQICQGCLQVVSLFHSLCQQVKTAAGHSATPRPCSRRRILSEKVQQHTSQRRETRQATCRDFALALLQSSCDRRQHTGLMRHRRCSSKQTTTHRAANVALIRLTWCASWTIS